MKKLLILITVLFLSSCTRVEPNCYGVLMKHYGRNRETDFSRQHGIVWVPPEGHLFQIPASEYLASSEKSKKFKTSDMVEFTVKFIYRYKVIEKSVVDLVAKNARLYLLDVSSEEELKQLIPKLNTGEEFMKNLENNVMDPIIYNIIKVESLNYTTDILISNSGFLKFQSRISEIMIPVFESKGLKLTMFSIKLEFSEDIKSIIKLRNELNELIIKNK